MTKEINHDEGLPKELFLRLSGTGEGNWETKRPQSIIMKLVEQEIFHGEILDIGCGMGDNAIYIANHANDVNITCIDLVPRALDIARQTAQQANINIQFEVVDILNDLANTNLKLHSFDVILDAGVFHAFSNEQRLCYIKNLEYLIKPNGLYIQIVYSEKETRNTLPRRVKKSDLNELFCSKNGWTIESIEDTTYDSRSDSLLAPNVQAYLSLIRRIGNI